MDYAHIRELQTANGHKATHTTKLTSIDNKLDGTGQIKMMASGDSGQTQIKSDNSGNVSVYAADNFPIFPANTLNGEHASHTQSIATMLRGRTDPASNLTGEFIKSTSNAIHTAPDVKRDSQILLSGVTLTTNTINTTSIDARQYKSIRLLGTALTGNSFVLMGSINNTNFFKIQEVLPQMHDSGFHFHSFLSECPPYLRVKGGSMSSDTYTIHYALLK